MRPLIPPPYSSTLYKTKTPYGYNTVHYSIYGRITAVHLPHRRYLTVATPPSLPHRRYLTVDISLLLLQFFRAEAFQLTPRLYTLYSFNCVNINPISPVRYRNI